MLFGGRKRVEDFEEAALPHLNDLFGTATSLLKDRSEAEDLVQEVYLEAWKSFHRFELGTNCRAWLFKILFHRLHHWRRGWFNRMLLNRSDKPLEEDAFVAEPAVPQELRDEDVLRALARMPVEYREVVLLADVEEFSYREVAATLDIPLGTVMSRLSRGRKFLRAELAELARSYGIKTAEKGGREGERA